MQRQEEEDSIILSWLRDSRPFRDNFEGERERERERETRLTQHSRFAQELQTLNFSPNP